MKKLIFPLIILLLALSCKAPTALLDKLEDDVKVANDLYLEIVSISPDENQLFTNPGEEVRIEFDRAIDLTSIDELVSILDTKGNVFGVTSDRKSLEYDFDESSNILTIAANPYLDGLEQYTVEILEGIKGTDGSLLRESLSWSFTTNDDPRGYVEIVDEYSSGLVTVNLFSEGATFYAIATSSDGVESSTDWKAITDNPMPVSDVPIAAVNGETSLYVKFRDGMVNEARSANVSRIESAKTIHDGIGPVISLSDIIYYANSHGVVPELNPIVSDALSGVNTYSWSIVSEVLAGLSFSATDTRVVTATPPAQDGDYVLRLTVTDNVGNSSSVDRTVRRDTVIPSAPVPNGPSITDVGGENPTTDTLPNYTFTNNADIVSYQYSINGSSTWRTYPGSAVLSYGNGQTIRFRGVDIAGNRSDPTVPDEDDTFFIYPSSGTSPTTTQKITGDLVWPRYNRSLYPYILLSPYHFKAYKVSGKSVIELSLANPLLPYVDMPHDDWTLSINSNYYWKFEVYSTNKFDIEVLEYTSPLLSFNTNFKGF